MMRRSFRFCAGVTIFLLTFYTSWAIEAPARINQANITRNIKKIKDVLKSKEWSPADSITEYYLKALISEYDYPTVDSTISVLDRLLDEKEILVVRDKQRIKNPESVKGYVPQRVISQKLKEIAEQIAGEYPAEKIFVPEEEFTQGFNQLDLIGEEDIERMLRDSIFVFPDSILQLLYDPATDENDSLRCHLDSVCTALIDQSRVAHNQSITKAFRDSISQLYRENYIQTLINSAQNIYLDSAYAVNNEILTRYNDSETLRMNHEIKEEIYELIQHLHQQPNPLIIENLRGEESSFNLRNGETWYKWIWLKNSQEDSIGIRVENIDKHQLRMLVDESVNLSRLTVKEGKFVDKIAPVEKHENYKLRKVITRTPIQSPWKLGGKAYAGFTETYFNQFWSQGGKTSASALFTFNYSANYEKNKLKWENSFDTKVGVIYYLPEDGVTNNRNWHKNNDNVEINSRLGLSAFKKWYYSAEANFKTQGFRGYKNQNDTIPSSDILSPAYLTFSAGMEYNPNKSFSAFLSPLSLKTTYVTNPLVDETKFGLLEGETHRSRFGISAKLNYTKKVMENINFTTKNTFFINYGNNNDGEWQFLKIPDFDSEDQIDFKINQFITTMVNVHFIYDKSVESTWTSNDVEKTGTRLQLKQIFTLGFSYKF